MKRVLSLVCAACILCSISVAQTHEAGVSVGVSNFMGDLGKKAPSRKTYFGDIEASLFRPLVSIFYRNHFNPWFAVRANIAYTKFEGNDKLAKSGSFQDDAWYRNYRNLHFKSTVIEIAVTGEVTFMKFIPGSLRHRFGPYFFTGIALMHFNPKAYYNGEWVNLQPLGTEGQGLPQYPDRTKYSLFQPTIPIGIGMKFNVNKYVTLTFEIGHRFTFTDYIDDVSNTYVSRSEFIAAYGEEQGSMVYDISVRSDEVDPEGTYDYVTIPGEVRGNPGGNDAYLFTSIGLSYKFANTFSEYSFSGRRNQIRKHPVSRKRTNKLRRHIRNKTW